MNKQLSVDGKFSIEARPLEPLLLVRAAVSLFMLTLMGTFTASAQVDTGTISGTVVDSSGGTVPGAKVSIVEQERKLEQSKTSNGDGTFVFTPVRVGIYTITAEAKGFQTSTITGATLNVQQNMKVKLTLAPGAVTSRVEVTTTAPLLQSEDASVGQVMTAREVSTLPLNGRNYTLLAQLAPGVTTAAQENRGLLASGSFVANGVPSLYNNYILDGIDNNNNTVDFLNGAAYAVRPPVDAIQEFKVQTSNFSAEFGRGGGAVVNAVLKSGTNELHGNLWEFVRNDKLDATDFFLNANRQRKGEFRRNQFGFTVGGPVYFPHLYDGRNKTFFFGDFEGTRIRQALPFTSSVPTAGERDSGYTDYSDLIAGQNGSQTDLLGRRYALGTIFDPTTTRAVTARSLDPVTGRSATGTGYVREPFPGNVIPASRIDPVAAKLLNLFPAPTGTGIVNNYASNPVKAVDSNSYDVRVDHSFGQNDQTFVRVSGSSEPQILPTPLGGLAEGSQSFAAGNQTNDVLNVAWSETHSFSPSTVNEFRIGYRRIHTVRIQPFGDQGGLNEQYGIPGIPDDPPNGGLAQIKISGLSELGGHNNLPLDEINGTLQFTENLSKQAGSHAMRMGAEYQRIKVGVGSSQFPHGYFAYTGQYTSVPNLNAASTGIAQFALLPSGSTVPGGIDNAGGANQVQISPLGQQDYRRPYYGVYFQDNWKATHRLTLNLGVRWEYFQLAQDHYGAQANFLAGIPFNGAEYLIDSRRQSTPLSSSFTDNLKKDGIQLAYSDNYSLGEAQKNNFAPRFGFAYQATDRFVVRAGYGIFFGGIFNVGDGANLGNNYPFSFGLNFIPTNAVLPITPDNSIGALSNGLLNVPLNPAVVNATGLNLRGVQYNFQTPYIQEMNFSLQYELTRTQSLTVGYVGSLGRHLLTTPGTNLQSVLLPPSANVQSFVPFPDFARGSSYSATEGSSFYHSLQAKYEKRYDNGLSFLGAYTWSKLRSDTSDTLFSPSGYRGANIPGFGIQGDYGLGSFDIRHAFHFSGMYELPFGNGRRYLSKGRFADLVLGGWNISGLVTLQTGQPFTVGCSVTTGAGTGCNALLVPGQDLYAGAGTPRHWVNAAAFSNPRVVTAVGQGDLTPLGGAPTQGTGPGFHRADISLAKQWRTSERTRLDFRTEVFNLTNTPNFAQPGSLNFANTTNFAQITATRDNPDGAREIQFGLKFSF